MVASFKLHFLNFSCSWISFQVFSSHLVFLQCELFIHLFCSQMCF